MQMTHTAGARLQVLLEERKVPSEEVVRITQGKKRLRLCRDRQRPDDATFAHNGRVVLVLAPTVAASLETRRLELAETTAGPRLRLGHI
ncbi:MAG TPA: hypothetical protein VHB77_14065, partial [Planctomycetaceae bacterium]|nr:hypothetical protein [Planctomycetaceae bacterium]